MGDVFQIAHAGPTQALPVALEHCAASSEVDFDEKIKSVLAAAGFAALAGKSVLVKPNLLKAEALACTDPRFVAGCCRYLLDLGCQVTVSDSPGFGTLAGVARHIGLDRALAYLGVPLVAMGPCVTQVVALEGRSVKLPVARTALECDVILSLPKVKAHSQMRLTLSVKNCYGCVPGWHKALLHARFGQRHEFFAGLICALYQLLPPVVAAVDGIVAMHVTGPGNGQPYPLQLIAACQSAPLLDEILVRLLGSAVAHVPLARALQQAGLVPCQEGDGRLLFPLAKPSDWTVTDFQVPESLLTTSFAPHRLLLSLLRRLWAQRPTNH
ncbi:MAG: DUF362 domain-containing protein [Desulfovibrio sp.]|nr:DUF362 domain-containing protein [Desulfovibrio sp.]